MGHRLPWPRPMLEWAWEMRSTRRPTPLPVWSPSLHATRSLQPRLRRPVTMHRSRPSLRHHRSRSILLVANQENAAAPVCMRQPPCRRSQGWMHQYSWVHHAPGRGAPCCARSEPAESTSHRLNVVGAVMAPDVAAWLSPWTDLLLTVAAIKVQWNSDVQRSDL